MKSALLMQSSLIALSGHLALRILELIELRRIKRPTRTTLAEIRRLSNELGFTYGGHNA